MSIYYPSNKEWTYDWSESRTEIRDTVIEMAKHGQIEIGCVGYDCESTPQTRRIDWFLKNVTIPELIKLTDYPNSDIKAIASLALLRKNYHGAYNLANKLMDDTTSVILVYSGCTGDYLLLSEFVFDRSLLLYYDQSASDYLFLRYGMSYIQLQELRIRHKNLLANKRRIMNSIYKNRGEFRK